jgi:hypothetical protein
MTAGSAWRWMQSGPRARRLLWCGLLIVAGAGGIAALGDVRQGNVSFRVWAFIALFGIQFVAYLAALSTVVGWPRRGRKSTAEASAQAPLWLVLSVALAARLVLFAFTPARGMNLSDDVHRYVWDGFAQHHGVNPYLTAPAEAPWRLRETPIGRAATHVDLPAVYPPLTELVFFILYGLLRSAWGFRLAFVFFDVATILLLLRVRNAECGTRNAGSDRDHSAFRIPNSAFPAVLVYAWHPLVIVEFAGNGHFDSLGIFLMVLAVYLLGRGRGWHAYLALAGSVAAKYIAAPLLLFFWPRARKAGLIAFVLVLLTLFWPYLPGGYTGLAQDLQAAVRQPPAEVRALRLFDGLRIYSQHYFANEGLYRVGLLITGEAIWYDPATRGLMAALVLALMIGLYLRRVDLPTAGLFTLGAIIVLNRVVYPWYACWIVPWIAWKWQVASGKHQVASAKCSPSASDTRDLPLGTCHFSLFAWLLFTGLIATSYTILIRYVPTMYDPEPYWVVPWWSQVLQYGTLVLLLILGALLRK